MSDEEYPQSLPHEKSVLSSLMKDPELLAESLTLEPDLFFRPAHRVILEAVREWVSIGFDLTTFVQRLHDRGQLDLIGGPADVSEIYTYATGSHRFRQHLEVLIEKRARRLAIQVGQEIRDRAFDQSDPDGYLAAASGPVTALHDAAAGTKPTLTTKAVVLDSINRFEARLNGQIATMGIPTLPVIDNHLKGLKGGRFWVIGAYPSGGKTLLCGQILIGCAKGEIPSLSVNLEMSEGDLMDRSIVQASGVPARAFYDPIAYAREQGNTRPAKEHLIAIRTASETLANGDLYRVLRPPNRKLGTILSAIRRAHREMGIKVACIDYLQLIQAGRAKNANKEEEIADISHAIQELAGELDIHILVASQLTKDGETKAGRVIEEDSDAFIRIMQNRDRAASDFGKHLGIKIDKDRHHGAGGTILPLALNKDYLIFEFRQPDETEEAAPKPRRFRK